MAESSVVASKLTIVAEGIYFLDNRTYQSEKGKLYNSIKLQDDHGNQFELSLDNGVPFPALPRMIPHRMVAEGRFETMSGFRQKFIVTKPLVFEAY